MNGKLFQQSQLIYKSPLPRFILEFKRTSSELERNFAGVVKNFHNLDLIRILGIELVKLGENWMELNWEVNPIT